MKIHKKIIVLIVSGMFLFSITTYATGDILDKITREQFESAGGNEANSAANSASEFLEDYDFSTTAMDLTKGKPAISGQRIVSGILDLLAKEVKVNIANTGKIILLAVIFSIISKFAPTKDEVFEAGFYVCYCVIFIIAMQSFNIAADIGKKAIEDMALFMKTSIPLMAGLTISSGGVIRSGMFTIAAMGIYSVAWTIEKIMMPLALISVSLSAVNNLSSDLSLKGLANLIKKISIWGVGIVTTIFTAVLALQGMTSGALDNIGVKAIKYTVGNFIPLIGGILSDSLDNVLACGQLIKSASGVAGVITVLYICIVPLVKLSAIILSYRIAAVIMGPVSDNRLTGAIEDFANALSILIAMVLSIGVMFIACMGIVATM